MAHRIRWFTNGYFIRMPFTDDYMDTKTVIPTHTNLTIISIRIKSYASRSDISIRYRKSICSARETVVKPFN